jgi:thiosulfate/3-mercaptopyruvate sulfurtransferase
MRGSRRVECGAGCEPRELTLAQGTFSMTQAENKADFLVDARWLRAHRDDPDLIIVDTRPAKDYWAGHLAGARHLDPFPFHYYDSDTHGTAEFKAQLEWIFSALGITTRKKVVFYEDNSGMRAARCAWALEFMGHPGAMILDGGLGALFGERLVTEAHPFAPERFDGVPRDEVAASRPYIVERLGRPEVQLFDVRSDAEYYGERVRARRGGAIPGAYHLDWTEALDAAGRFKPAAELRSMYGKLGLDPDAEIITYCQGGYRAAHAYFALRLAGYPNARNYWGSWAEWGNREDAPIEHPRRPKR